MVNEERIKLMTRMAAYEKEEHKKNRAIVGFFKSDYISMQMIKSMIASTLAFAIVFGLYVLYDFELFMKEIYKMDMFEFLKPRTKQDDEVQNDFLNIENSFIMYVNYARYVDIK